MNQLSLKVRVIILITITAAILATSMLLTVYQLMVSDYEALVSEREQAKIERLVAELGLTQQQRLLSLEAFTARVLDDNGALLPPTILQERLQRPSVASDQFPDGLLVFDGSATAIAERDFVPNRLGTNYADRMHFQRAEGSKKPVISEPILGRVTGLPLLSFLHPIISYEGNIIGYIGGTLDLSNTPLMPSIPDLDNDPYVTTIVIDPHNRLFVSVQERFTEPQKLPAQGTDALVDAAAELRPSGSLIEHEQRRYIVATQALPDLGWIVLRAIPYEMAIAPAKATYRRFLYISLAALLSVALAAIWAASSLTLPLTRMTDRLNNMAKDARLDSDFDEQGGPEIASLARAMNRLAQERNSADAAVRETEGFLTSVLEAATELSIIATDSTGIITVFNKGSENLLGYSKDELVQKKTPALLHLESEVIARAQELSDELGAPIQGFQVFVAKAEREGLENREWTYVHKSGRHITVSLTVTVVRDEAGTVKGYLGIAQDITARKRMDQMKSEFISTVSHELRTPLTSISGALGLIVGGGLGEVPDKVNHLLSTAHRNSKRLGHLINDLLDIEKIASGKLHFDMQPQPLTPLILQAIESNEAYGAPRGITINFSDTDLDPHVQVDGQRLLQVLANLLSNAIKFSPDDSAVNVFLESTDNGVVVSIKDHGPGIPMNFRNKIFQRFAQADASDTRAKDGTGLGLAITRELIEHMGGRVGFDSKEGGGARFFFELPLAKPLHRGDSLPGLADNQATRARILVVEDDPDVAHLLMIMLNEAGYDCDTAYSGNDALRMLDETRYDLVSLDLMLPDISGLDIIGTLRRQTATRDLPIVVVSAKVEQGKLAIGGDVSHLDWLTKPIDQKHLIEVIQRQLEAARAQHLRVLHVEDDKDLHSVICAMAGDQFDIQLAPTLDEARHQVQDQHFDVILLDIGLPDGSGWDLLPDIRIAQPDAKVVILSGADLSAQDRENVEAVLLKSRLTPEALVDGISVRIQWYRSHREE
ncbi:response regulator [Salinispirillum sp. LH 10-3-1]|uniref:histidine kinase n=1 Tax=Salinispirillum sp. LH 10-3-1 TaxID=2952525 RepID=A0AB38YF18_9GAMM